MNIAFTQAKKKRSPRQEDGRDCERQNNDQFWGRTAPNKLGLAPKNENETKNQLDTWLIPTRAVWLWAYGRQDVGFQCCMDCSGISVSVFGGNIFESVWKRLKAFCSTVYGLQRCLQPVCDLCCIREYHTWAGWHGDRQLSWVGIFIGAMNTANVRCNEYGDGGPTTGIETVSALFWLTVTFTQLILGDIWKSYQCGCDCLREILKVRRF